jgi:polyphosphate kinase
MMLQSNTETDGDFVWRVGGDDHNSSRFLNREMSWLAFNGRVLALADDERIPLLDRLRFVAIFSGNLDEFFQVRVAGLSDQVEAGVTSQTADGRGPQEQLDAIASITRQQTERAQALWHDELRPRLERAGVTIVDWPALDLADQQHFTALFRTRIFPTLTPLAVDPGHPFPYISDLSLNLAVVLTDPHDGRRLFARVKVPPPLPRFLRAPDEDRFVPVEQVIAAHLEQLFPGMRIAEHHLFRVTRNADLTVKEGEADDLLAAVETELRRRRNRKEIP